MRSRLLAFLVVLSIGAVACGGGNGQSSDAAGGDGEGQAAADPGGVVRIAYPLSSTSRGTTTLDSAKATTPLADTALYHWIYGGLMRPGPDGSLVPDLAESATVVDPNTVEVVLRDGVTLPDGSPLDAEVVKAALERNLTPPRVPGFDAGFYKLASVEVVDPARVRLVVPDGTAAGWADQYLGGAETVVVPPGTDFNRPAGAGPFRVVEHVPGEKVVLEKNPAYWDADAIKVARIELVNTPDAQTAVSALNAGQVDWARLDPAALDAVGSELEVQTTPDANLLTSLQICKTDEPFSDPKVRQALSMAIDRGAISEAVFRGTAVPASDLWPDDHRLHNPDSTDKYAYDPDAARDLLDEAGYADGFTVDIIPFPSSGMPDVAQVIQQQFAEVGVTMNIVPTSNYVEDFNNKKKAPMSVSPSTGPAGLRRVQQWVGPELGNVCGYDDAELDALAGQLKTISSESDDAVDLWHQVQDKIVDDALSIFVLFRSNVAAHDPARLGDVVSARYINAVPEVRDLYVKA